MDVLNGSKRFDLGDEVVFLPNAEQNEYVAEVSNANGLVKSVKLEVVSIPAYGKFSILRPIGDSFVDVNVYSAYTYQIKAGNQVLKQINFTVSEAKSSDPFNPSTGVKVDGPWKSTAYLLSDPARPEEALTFDCYSNLDESGSNSRAQFTITVLKGGVAVAQTRPYTLSKQTWSLQSNPLYKPDNKFYFRTADLLALNSDFEIVIKHDGKRVKSFRGSTAGKAFKGLTEAVLPKTLIIPSGQIGKAHLVDVFWMKGN